MPVQGSGIQFLCLRQTPGLHVDHGTHPHLARDLLQLRLVAHCGIDLLQFGCGLLPALLAHQCPVDAKAVPQH